MTIQTKTDTLGQTFGGYTELLTNTTIARLRQITNFPGELVVTYTSAILNTSFDQDDIDLTLLGYIPGSTYKVYDSNLKYLYSAQSTRYFGEAVADQNLAIITEHADYYYLHIQTATEPKVVLLWLATELSRADQELALSLINKDYDRIRQTQTRPIESELFIYSQVYDYDVTLFIYPGQLQIIPSLFTLLKQPRAYQIDFKARKGQLFKYLADHWFLATTKVYDQNQTHIGYKIWSLGQAFGSGIARVTSKPNGLNYVGAAGLNRVSLTSPQQQTLMASLVAQIALDQELAYIPLTALNTNEEFDIYLRLHVYGEVLPEQELGIANTYAIEYNKLSVYPSLSADTTYTYDDSAPKLGNSIDTQNQDPTYFGQAQPTDQTDSQPNTASGTPTLSPGPEPNSDCACDC